jgi:hypothetical protein
VACRAFARVPYEEDAMTRKRSFRTFLFISVALLAVLAFATPAFAAGKMPTTNIPIDGTDLLRDLPAPRQVSTDLLGPGSPDPNDYTHTGTDGVPHHADMVLKLYDMSSIPQGAHYVAFWKEASGEHSDIYVAWDDLSSPATSTQQYQTITDDDVQYMKSEFDTRIWASDVFHFGNYDARPAGTEEGNRAGIFIYNIRDDAFWSSYRYYIAGYFSSGLNDELHINAIFIDSFDWPNRTRSTSARPNLYEGTIAHEFEHLIHSDVDNGEDSFIDEGMADLAEQFIYGTKTTASHIGEYLYYHRDSLLDWKGELFDYGNSVLWQDYLWEQAGGDKLVVTPGGDPLAGRVATGKDPFADDATKFIDAGDRFTWNLIHDDLHGLAGVAHQVGDMNKVEQLHRDYTLANLLDGKVSESKWNYHNLVLGGPDSYGYSIDEGIAYYESNVRGNMPPTRKNVRRNTGTEAWGAYYRTFTGSEPGYTMAFTGRATDGIAPSSGSHEWYGGLGNMLDRELTRTIADVPAASVLTFKTWFDIEEDWDYGYVQASSDGVNWTTLPQLTSLRTGVTDINGSTAWKIAGAGGFTGSSGGWKDASFNLSGFTGDVRLRFRYVTDEAANGQGWYVDDIAGGVPTLSPIFSDPVETVNGWATDAANGWLFTTGMQGNDWTADSYAVYQKALKTWYTVRPVVGVAGTGLSGSLYIPAQYLKSGKTYGIVSNRPRDGIMASAGRLWILKGK